MSGNRVLLMTLSCRTSAKGNSYLAGWLGKASVVAFKGEPDKFGNETWDLFLCEPEPKRDSVQKPPASPPERDEAPMPAQQRPPSLARVLGARSRRSGATGRRARRRSASASRPRSPAATGSARAIRMIRCRSETALRGR
jgi:hypothetical protein